MKIQNLQENTKSAVALAPYNGADNDDQDGTGIDLLSFTQCHSALALCHVGAATGTPDSFSIVFTLEDSADNVTYSPVSGKTATRTTAGLSEISFNPSTLQRYVRLNRVLDITNGSSPKVPSSASFLFGAPHRAPLS